MNGCAPALGRSADLEVFRRFLPAVADDFILDGLPLIEAAQSGSLDSRNVDEHVLAAALRLNESVTLGRVEPLYGPGSHHRLLALCTVVNRSCAKRAMQQVRVLEDDLR